MPLIIFKIFIALCLQAGARPGDKGFPTANLENILVANNMVLSIDAEAGAMEEILLICSGQTTPFQISRDMGDAQESCKARVEFTMLPYAKRNELMKRLTPMMGRAQLQWREL